MRFVTIMAATVLASLAGTMSPCAAEDRGTLVQPLGGGFLPPGRTEGVEHVFSTGPMAMHVLLRRGTRTDLLAFRDPAPRLVEDVPEGGTSWAEAAPDGKVTFHLRHAGQAG